MERDVQVGQLVAGKYRIQQMLGRGGMGVVMAALHEHLNQRVALKFLTDDAYQQPEAVTRFLREARAAAQLQTEHVARVMDVGTLESGAPYIVMEYLHGLDLKDVSTRRGPLPISEAVDYVIQACVAVAEAHALGIVHRDLKPSNLFLTERADGSSLVKVLDFGISKALHGGRAGETSQHQMTASAAIMGSPQYMSPEQIRSSKNVDARADIWALGTILHELVAGMPAYVADTVPGLLAMIVADAPPPLTASRADAPPELEAVILRCLEKDRERRYASVAELARAVERFASAEVRPLVRRISRVLGEAEASPYPSSMSAPGGLTAREPAVQTFNTWARTGKLSDGAPGPFYARPAVQLGAAVGLVGASVLGWILFVRAPTDTAAAAPVAAPTMPAKAGASTASVGSPNVVKPAAPIIKAGALPKVTDLPAPTTGGVRPLREAEALAAPSPDLDQPEAPSSRLKGQAPAVDDDPRAAHNFRDEARLYPSASAKKRELAAAAARRARSRTAPARAASRATSPEPSREREPAPAANVSPPSPPKKSDTLDLFNDTK